MVDSREAFKSLLESTFISAKWDDMRIYAEMVSFLNKVISLMPERLYRYRKLDEKGYSLNSFEKGTISLCKAKCFSDKYDSIIFVNAEKEVAKSEEVFRAVIHRAIQDVKRQSPNVRPEKASLLCDYLKQGMTEEEIVDRIIKEYYTHVLNEQRDELKQSELRFRDSDKTARIACFTESVQSKYMWDTYAGGYTGFALEYNLKEYYNTCFNKNRPVYIFPVIYSNERPDLTIDESNFYVFNKMKERNWLDKLEPYRQLLDFNLLSPHKPFLYKDEEAYKHEKEWRMLLYDEKTCEDYIEIPDDGCLKAIYYGMDIKPEDQERLHQIAQKKGIKEYKVSIDKDSPKYSLKVIPLDS